VVELADTRDLKSLSERSEGSNPSRPTNYRNAKNRCSNCGHRTGMFKDGRCTVMNRFEEQCPCRSSS
jgi:ribosomal protein S14